jgi:cell division protein FtsQ
MAKSEAQSIRKTFKRLVAFAGGLFLLGILLTAVEYKFNSNSGTLTINIESINEKRYILPEDIGKLIKRTFYGEDNPKTVQELLSDETLGTINLKALETVIDNYPWVKASDVYVDANNNITVNIIQREPVLRCFDERNNAFYIDEFGNQMPISEHESARVIVANGYIKNPEKGTRTDSLYNVVDSLCKLALFIQKDTFLTAQFEQIYVERNQDFTLIPKVGDSEVLLGDLKLLEDKFKRLRIFYLEAMPREGWRKYEKINLKYKKQVVGVKN